MLLTNITVHLSIFGNLYLVKWSQITNTLKNISWFYTASCHFLSVFLLIWIKYLKKWFILLYLRSFYLWLIWYLTKIYLSVFLFMWMMWNWFLLLYLRDYLIYDYLICYQALSATSNCQYLTNNQLQVYPYHLTYTTTEIALIELKLATKPHFRLSFDQYNLWNWSG